MRDSDGIEGGNRKRLDRHLQNHALPRNSTWTWKRVEGLRGTSSSDRQRLFSVILLIFFIFSRFVLWRKLQAKLSLRLDHRHLQHQCVEFCHSLILIVGNGYYLLLQVVATLTRNFVYLLTHIWLKILHTRRTSKIEKSHLQYITFKNW